MNAIKNLLSPALFERVKLVLLKPSECWDSIASEEANTRHIMWSLVVPLAVISNACQFIGFQLFGVTVPLLGTWRPPFFSSLAWHIGLVIIHVGIVFVGAIIVEKIAKLFKGDASRDRAYSLLAHSMIPGSVGGMLGIFPLAGILGIVFAILGLFTLYSGSTKMTTVAESNKLLFTLAIVVSLIAISLVAFPLASLIIAQPVPGLNVS